jgi:hypothetical protein
MKLEQPQYEQRGWNVRHLSRCMMRQRDNETIDSSYLVHQWPVASINAGCGFRWYSVVVCVVCEGENEPLCLLELI